MTREYREYAKSRIEYLLKICRLDERDKEALEAAIKALSQVSEIEENIIKYMKKYPNHVGNIDFWEGFYACRNVVLQLDDEEYAPKEQEPTDAISRADAQTEIMMSKSIVAFDRDIWIRTKDAVHILRQLPSVTQKSGKWIITYPQGKHNPIYGCPRCHASNSSIFRNYCPNCGYKLESEE